jgi:SAM-dependent methyltransferase
VSAEPPDSLYEESAYYRALFAERAQDLPFYRRVSRDVRGEVLELGVGEGRVALTLAAEGCRVVGVDRSSAMLEALRARLREAPAHVAARVEAHLGDVASFRLGRRVARVLCPFNALAHFHDDGALDAFFETVRAHLEPDGLFAFDVLVPDPTLLGSGASTVPWVRHPRTGAVCRLEEHHVLDPSTRVLTLSTTFVERETEARQTLVLRLRQYAPEETLALLARHGFEPVEPAVELGDSLAYVCRRRGNDATPRA